LSNQGFDYIKLVLRDEFLALKELFIERKIFLIVVIAILISILAFLKPFPPLSVTLTTVKDSDYAYARYAQYLRDELEQKGLKVNLVVTAGSVENANLLESPKSDVSITFIQGGALSHEQSKKFYSLGSVFYEPVWIFCRKDLVKLPKDLIDLARLNLQVGLGPAGGGTLPLIRRLFAVNDIDISNRSNFRVSSYEADADDLLNSKLDCAIEVMPYFDKKVQSLLRNPKISLIDAPDAKAYQMSLSYIEDLVIPAHSIDIAKSIPDKDITLIATTTTLAVKKDLNEDIQNLLLVSARNRSQESQNLFFSSRGEFPKYMDPAIPLSPVARSFYNDGLPALFSHLPFFLAGFINRLWVFMLTAFALLYPLAKLNMKLRSTNYVIKQQPYFEELLSIERKITTSHLDKSDADNLLQQLDMLNQKVISERIPIGMESSYFSLLGAIELVRNKISSNPRY
jgi:TRAP-type uncharacterized transport system substrate-binding protein